MCCFSIMCIDKHSDGYYYNISHTSSSGVGVIMMTVINKLLDHVLLQLDTLYSKFAQQAFNLCLNLEIATELGHNVLL